MTMKIGIFGAGAIGSFVGGYLAASGEDVVFMGRARGVQNFAKNGLMLTHFNKPDVKVTPDMALYSDDAAILSACNVIFITVKSQDTTRAAAQLAPLISPDAQIISLQNGVGNTDILAANLGNSRVFKAMIPNNVLAMGDGRYHMGTEGAIAVEDAPALMLITQAMKTANLDVLLRPDMSAAQWTKLIMNLSNACNTLAGLTIYDHLHDRDHRRVLALCIDETLAVLNAASISPPRLGKVNPKILPPLLRLPDFIYHRLMPFIIKIDPQARSSMAQDRIAGKRTSEIDALNGAVIALGRQVGIATPVNDYITAQIKAAFAEDQKPQLLGKDMLACLKQ